MEQQVYRSEEDLLDPPRQEESDEAEPLSRYFVSVNSECRRGMSQEAHSNQVETGGGMRILRVRDRSRENGSAKERPCPYKAFSTCFRRSPNEGVWLRTDEACQRDARLGETVRERDQFGRRHDVDEDHLQRSQSHTRVSLLTVLTK